MKKCLIADNNEFYLEFFSDLLKGYGYDVDKSLDGLTALNLARKSKYDLFIFDYIMPKVDGVRLSKYIRSIPEYANTPIILITAAALESIKMDEMQNYADIFIAKGPFEKMKEIFDNLLPELDNIVESKERKILGLSDIYPRQIVKELLKTEFNHSAIFKNLIEGIVQVDEEYRILFVNDSFCKYLKMSEESLIGNDIRDIFDKDSYPYLSTIFSKLRDKNSTVKENTVINFGDKTFHVSIYNLVSEKNLFAGAFLILQDITEIKKKINEVTTIFNITQAFLSNLEYRKVLEYVIYELRRLIKAADIALVLSCDGIFNGEVIQNRDRKLHSSDIRKIDYWIDKIIDWKKTGLISIKNIPKLNKLKFENIPTLWQPLIFQKTYLGTLLGFKQADTDFDEDEMRFFEAVGNQIAVYLSNIEFLNKSDKKEKDIKKITQTFNDDIFEKNLYLKWEERQKKKVIQRLCENLSNNISLLDGYLGYMNSNLNLEKEEDKNCLDKILFVDNKLKTLKDDLCIINRIGGNEETNMQIFEISDILRKIKENFSEYLGSYECEIPSFQKWGDYDKIWFIIKKLFEELLIFGAKSFDLKATKEEKLRLLINFYFDSISNSLKELTGIVNEENWSDYDDLLYYLFHNLKSLLTFLNATLELKLESDKLGIIIDFQT